MFVFIEQVSLVYHCFNGIWCIESFSNVMNYRFWQSLLDKASNLSINLNLLSYGKHLDLITHESNKSII